MIEKFGQDMPKRTYRCPGTPRFTAELKSIRDEHVLNESKMTMYRSGVGMLLYLQKHSRPDISNATRELSKCLTKATMLHYKELLRVMKFVVQTKDLGLRLKVESTSKLLKEPEVNNPKMIHWYLVAFPDASFASDKDNRHSITGFVIYFCGAPISWKSKIQRSVTTSSTESEYIAIADVVKEIMYIRNLLRSIGIQVGLPVVVNVDNLGAMYISKNAGSAVRTKHIDINYHYVKEYCEKGICYVRFVNTKLQDGDIMTKNVSSPVYQLHAPKLIGKPNSD